MNKIIVFIIATSLLSCNSKNTETEKESKVKAETFDWLLGEWKKNDELAGKETFEIWEKVNENEYSGIGFTLRNADTIPLEKMRLLRSADHWDLFVKTPKDIEYTTFDGTNHSEFEFTCENNEIEFPNIIKYWIEGELLNATVSSSELSLSFEFQKIK